MNKWRIIILLLIGVSLLFGSVLLRILSKGIYEIKTIDLVFIIIPLLLVGLATGKVRGLDLFGVRADLSELWKNAADTQIDLPTPDLVSQVEDAIEMIDTRDKGGVEEIPALIAQRTQALAFQLGMGRYYGQAIKKYLNDLYGSSYLRYVIINDQNNTFFGMYDAADFIAYLRTLGDDTGYDILEQQLNQGSRDAMYWFARLPGFVSSDKAITAETSKRDALQKMEDLKLETLPVIDSTGHFIGTVERSKLTSSLILAVTKNLSIE